ncbi:MAG: hypothetical protein HYT03_00875 [Candidatus Harrisonbacteria bacterium]|nr:hypothetical protein [Candidatus Harrisonbacteria bacterium]
MRIFLLFLVLLAVSAVAIADVFLKRAGMGSGFGQAMKSLWFWGAVALYLFQIGVFLYLFISGTKLISVGVMQTILYAVIILGSGILFFGETLTALQATGVILGILGVILINI